MWKIYLSCWMISCCQRPAAPPSSRNRAEPKKGGPRAAPFPTVPLQLLLYSEGQKPGIAAATHEQKHRFSAALNGRAHLLFKFSKRGDLLLASLHNHIARFQTFFKGLRGFQNIHNHHAFQANRKIQTFAD